MESGFEMENHQVTESQFEWLPLHQMLIKSAGGCTGTSCAAAGCTSVLCPEAWAQPGHGLRSPTLVVTFVCLQITSGQAEEPGEL